MIQLCKMYCVEMPDYSCTAVLIKYKRQETKNGNTHYPTEASAH